MMTVCDEAEKYSLVDCMGSEISTAQDNLGYALGIIQRPLYISKRSLIFDN